MWNELLAACVGIAIGAALVSFIHKTVTGHLNGASAKRTILSMEVAAFGLMLGAFTLGEVARVAQLTSRAGLLGDHLPGLAAKDVAVIFGALAASVFIYLVASKVMSHRRPSRRGEHPKT